MDCFENSSDDGIVEYTGLQLKQLAGFGKGGHKNFDGIMTDLQMQTYLVIKEFRRKQNRRGEYFGFTDMEVRQMLEYYGFSDQYDAVKEWYDGYLFGNLGIYCPWDVINYCGDLRDGSVTEPQNYWVNTSSNDIIRRFLSRAKTSDRNDIEQLINGNSIKKQSVRN